MVLTKQYMPISVYWKNFCGHSNPLYPYYSTLHILSKVKWIVCQTFSKSARVGWFLQRKKWHLFIPFYDESTATYQQNDKNFRHYLTAHFSMIRGTLCLALELSQYNFGFKTQPPFWTNPFMLSRGKTRRSHSGISPFCSWGGKQKCMALSKSRLK